jgi:hypothetical protein
VTRRSGPTTPPGLPGPRSSGAFSGLGPPGPRLFGTQSFEALGLRGPGLSPLWPRSSGAFPGPPGPWPSGTPVIRDPVLRGPGPPGTRPQPSVAPVLSETRPSGAPGTRWAPGTRCSRAGASALRVSVPTSYPQLDPTTAESTSRVSNLLILARPVGVRDSRVSAKLFFPRDTVSGVGINDTPKAFAYL